MRTKKQRRRRKVFFEGIDSYSDEYESWKKTQRVKRLVGVFEVSHDDFSLPHEELLAAVGLGDYTLVTYAAEYDNTPGGDEPGGEPIISTGCTTAVRNVYGRIVPVVFVKKDVQVVGRNPQRLELADSIRLMVLLHELGHADDISKGLNYDHENMTIDLAAAEAYAHAFVCREAQRSNYPSLLNIYLENLERIAKSSDDAQRVGAERFLEGGKAAELRAWIAERRSKSGLIELIERSGRAEELLRKSTATPREWKGES